MHEICRIVNNFVNSDCLVYVFCSDCGEKDPAPEGKDDEVAKRLWEESARLVGLNNQN